MKTMQELYDEIMGSEELKKEFLDSGKSKETMEAFLKSHGCDVTIEEFAEFLKENAETNEEMSKEELKAVAGGSEIDLIFSIILAVGCIAYAITSACTDDDCTLSGQSSSSDS